MAPPIATDFLLKELMKKIAQRSGEGVADMALSLAHDDPVAHGDPRGEFVRNHVAQEAQQLYEALHDPRLGPDARERLYQGLLAFREQHYGLQQQEEAQQARRKLVRSYASMGVYAGGWGGSLFGGLVGGIVGGPVGAALGTLIAAAVGAMVGAIGGALAGLARWAWGTSKTKSPAAAARAAMPAAVDKSVEVSAPRPASSAKPFAGRPPAYNPDWARNDAILLRSKALNMAGAAQPLLMPTRPAFGSRRRCRDEYQPHHMLPPPALMRH